MNVISFAADASGLRLSTAWWLIVSVLFFIIVFEERVKINILSGKNHPQK
uniref:Uncharacterized protein n=1 Tax=Salmonella enterica subsp. salamae TaxID=59202 RepID=I3W468_SALER|nr:hypothetical protein [Salmonella enterica subsp. salamae]